MLKKVFAFILAMAFGIGALLLFAGYLGKKDETPHRPRPAVKPVYFDFATFSGQTPGETRTFRIDRGPWRLHWEIEGLPNSASAGLTVFSANEAVPPVFEENGLAPPARGTITIKKPGTYYVVVSSFDADWRLIVQRREEAN